MTKIVDATWFKPFKAVYRAWLKVAHAIGKVNTLILLTFFYLVVLGIARLTTLLLGKDTLDMRLGDRVSYWRQRQDFTVTREAFLKPY